MYVVNLEMDNSPKQVLFNMKPSDTKRRTVEVRWGISYSEFDCIFYS